VAELVVYPQLLSKHNRQYREQQGPITVIEGSRNCGAAGGAALANAAGSPAELITHHAYRLAAGDPRNNAGEPRGLGTLEHVKALESYGVTVSRHYGEPISALREALQAGLLVGLAIGYDSINRHYPRYSGQATFQGGHFVVLAGYTPHDKRIGYRNSTTVGDGLWDGRCRDWGCAPPVGARVAPFRAYRLAAGAFKPDGKTAIGADKAVFIIVERGAE